MSFKEFKQWVKYRMSQNQLTEKEIKKCTFVIKYLNHKMFWNREKIWQDWYEQDVVRNIVKPVDEYFKRYN